MIRVVQAYMYQCGKLYHFSERTDTANKFNSVKSGAHSQTFCTFFFLKFLLFIGMFKKRVCKKFARRQTLDD